MLLIPNKNMLVEDFYLKKIGNCWRICFKNNGQAFEVPYSFRKYRSAKSAFEEYKESFTKKELYWLIRGTNYISKYGIARASTGLRAVKGFKEKGDFNVEKAICVTQETHSNS